MSCYLPQGDHLITHLNVHIECVFHNALILLPSTARYSSFLKQNCSTEICQNPADEKTFSHCANPLANWFYKFLHDWFQSAEQEFRKNYKESHKIIKRLEKS